MRGVRPFSIRDFRPPNWPDKLGAAQGVYRLNAQLAPSPVLPVFVRSSHPMSQLPRDEQVTHNQRVKALRAQGLTLKEVAKEVGRHVNSVSQLLARDRRGT